MKNLVYLLAMFVFTAAWSQEKPKEVKQETEVETVKYNDGSSTTEKKVKVVKRESADVKLNDKHQNKVNQDRVKATKKVEKIVMIDNDGDSGYEILTKETSFVNDNSEYKFIPNNNKGFDIVFDSKNKKAVKVGKAWTAKVNGGYIISGKMQNGFGYFDQEGNFIIEYYDEDSNAVETKIYKKGKM
ncbi:hypothetical protein [Flavisericum labens]|uniref:hypothetical protein n=1 Tax=Flavisericum labens TaxID=3377112 RepID=UPI00387AF29D